MSRTPENNYLRAVGMLQAGSMMSTAWKYRVWQSMLGVSWNNYQNMRSIVDMPRITTLHHPFAPKEQIVACHCHCWRIPGLCNQWCYSEKMAAREGAHRCLGGTGVYSLWATLQWYVFCVDVDEPLVEFVEYAKSGPLSSGFQGWPPHVIQHLVNTGCMAV